MDLTTITLTLPIVLVAYHGTGMLLESRKRSGFAIGQRRFSSTTKSLQDFTRFMGQMGFNQAILNVGRLRQRLDLLLVRGGHPLGWKAGDFLFYKELSAILAAVALWQGNVRQPLAWIVAAAAAFMLPDIFMQLHGSSRRTSMQRQLPSFVDLLALTIESGLDLVVAVERIVEQMKPGPLRDELQILMQESRLGTARKDILKRWAHRTGLADIQSLTSLIIQSEEMGTPLAGVLRSYAEDMRSRRILRAEEIAGKIPVKILFPMMIFFFPIVFVIILGPVALEFFKNYK